MKVVGRLVSVAAVVTSSVAMGVLPAQAGTGPSGTVYTFKTVCSTGTVMVYADTRSVPVDVTFTVFIGSASKSFVAPSGSGANITVDGFLVVPDDTVTVQESGVPVGSESYSNACPSYVNNQNAATRSRFVAVPPDRILDTRPATQKNYSAAKPAAGGVFNLVMPGLGGIPAGASAVVLNVTATDPAGPGFVQLFTAGQSTPGSSSNLNLEGPGQSIPNAVIVPLGTGGAVSFFTSTSVHVVVDVAGYFVPVGSSDLVAGGRFSAADPTRVLDTRPATAINFTGAKPAAAQTIEFAVNNIPGGPTPAEITAVVLNVTATEASAPGFVQAAAGGGVLVPGSSSSLNIIRVGQTIPNLVIVPVSATGTVALYTSGGAHLLADVMGYFTSDSTAPSRSGLFVPLSPERILDSRPATQIDGYDFRGVPGDLLTMSIAGLPYLDLGAVILNVTATQSLAPGFVQVGPVLVPGSHSNLNLERAGQTIPNAVLVPVSDINDLDFYTSGGTQLVADIFGWFTY